MATKSGIAKTISDQYKVKCECRFRYDGLMDYGDEWTVNDVVVKGSAGAKTVAKILFKLEEKL